MARRRAKIFSERELEVMNAVWKLGKASVKQIRDEMGGDGAGAYTSIATMLKFLESKGALRHEQFGRTYYYAPNTTKDKEQQKALQYILGVYFNDNIIEMVDTLMSSVRISEQEMDSVEKMLTNQQQRYIEA